MPRLALVLLGLLAFGIASCGGGDDPPSRDDFAERANEICRDVKQSLEDVAEDAESPEDIAKAVDRVIEESRNAVDDLADLELPEGAAGDRAEQFVDANRKEIEDEGIPALQELGQAIKNRDQEAVQEAAKRLQEIDTADSNRAAREVGADACA